MSAGVLDVIGLVAGVAFGVIGLLPSANPDPLANGNSIVRVGVGLQDVTMGGDVPVVTLFNEKKDQIGEYYDHTNRKVDAGAFADLVVDQTAKYQQPTYAQLYTGADAICIAYIGQTWPDGIKRGWLGDMGKICGQKNYFSNLIVSTADGSLYKPYCTWMDADGSNGIEVTGFTLHMTDFSTMGDSGSFSVPDDETSLCSAPHMWWTTLSSSKTKREIENNEAPVESRKRRSTTSATPFNGTVIASHDAQHHATALCASPSSWGPDFVSFDEGVFCDMTTRLTWQLCNATTTSNCYDWDSHILVDTQLRKRELGYTKVIEWK